MFISKHPPKWTKCGVFIMIKNIRYGFGGQWIIKPIHLLPIQLSEFHIGTVYADNNFAYDSRISPDKLVTGKRNTQQIERDHLTLRTRIKRLARKTICFSKDLEIHKAVIGTFINIFFFGHTFDSSTIL